jgi:RNA polymerase sigma-70 factor (ECF subfamily)
MANSITADGIGAATISAAAAGDALALERIIARYHRDLARVCVVVCGGDADLAEDAVQAAWVVAWRKLGGLRDPDRLQSWLVAVAANEARRQVRQRRGRVVELSLADATAADDIGRSPAAIDLRTALQQLKPEDREILALRHVAGLDSTEIGRVVGMSASGVRTRLERLLARLRSELGDD